MIGCVSQELLIEFVAGRLTAEQAQAISSHLVACPACQQAIDTITDDPEVREFQRCHRQQSAPPDHSESLGTLRRQLYAVAADGAPPATSDTAATLAAANRGDSIPEVLGRFRLKQRLGAGGFGIVYLAEDTQLDRLVALKIPRATSLTDPDAHERFLREVRAAAGLHHPQIVAVYDAGPCEGTFYLASAYCPGVTLSQWLSDRGAPAEPDQAAVIVLALSEAAQHAHENGVLHRDIKPQNVLLDPTLQFRDLPFSPKLTDFSVAKLMDDAGDATASHVLIGTPRYMAPEQVSGRRDLLGPACDVYALGVVLYELITAEPPIRGDDNADTLRRVLSDHPIAPRELAPAVPRDLEAICLKCLEKAPDRRYASARALADDLERFLVRQPTVARPIRSGERLLRWIRRRPATASLLGAGALLALLVVSSLVLYNARLNAFNESLGKGNAELAQALEKSRRAEAQATSSENHAQQLLYVSDLRLANLARLDGDVHTLSNLLRRHVPGDGQPDRRGLEWRFLRSLSEVKPQSFARQPHAVYYLRASPDGRQLAAAGQEAIVRLYDLASGSLLQSVDTEQREVNSVAFSSDGRRLATAGDDGTVRVWKLDDGAQVLRIAAHPGLAFGVWFTPDDALLVSCGNEPSIRLWDAQTGVERGTLVGHEVGVEAIALAPSGQQLASAGADGKVRIWNLAERREILQVTNRLSGYPFSAVVFSPDGTWVAASDIDRNVWIWDPRTGQLLADGRHLDPVHTLAISDDGRFLASADGAGVVCLWNVAHLPKWLAKLPEKPNDLPLVQKWSGHEGRVNTLLLDRANRLFSAGADGQIQVWSTTSVAVPRFVENDLLGMVFPSFTQDGRLLAVQKEEKIVVWDPRVDSQLEHVEQRPSATLIARTNGRRDLLATCTKDGGIEVWDLTGANKSQAASAIAEEPPDASGKKVGTPSLGRRLAGCSLDANQNPAALCPSPDGKLVALVVREPRREVRLLESATGALRATLPLSAGTVGRVEFSPDGTQIAANTDDDVLLWSVTEALSSGRPEQPIPATQRIAGSHSRFMNLAYSPDGQRCEAFFRRRFVG